MPVTVWQVRKRVPPAAGSDLSPAVFCQLLRLLCVPAATISSLVQQVDDIFKLYDGASGSKDGVIDYDEFQKVLRDARGSNRVGQGEQENHCLGMFCK